MKAMRRDRSAAMARSSRWRKTFSGTVSGATAWRTAVHRATVCGKFAIRNKAAVGGVATTMLALAVRPDPQRSSGAHRRRRAPARGHAF